MLDFSQFRNQRESLIFNPFSIAIAILIAVCVIGNIRTAIAAETGVTVTSPIGAYPASVDADDLNVSWTATDSVNGNTIPITGREFLLFRLSANAADVASVTLDTIADNLNRENDIVGYELSPGETAAFKINNTVGWKNTAGNMSITSSSSGIEVLVIRW